jgi:apolipoprotein N-acyltransferase
LPRTYLPCVLSGLLFGLSFPSYPYVRLEVLAWVWMVPLLISLKDVQSLPRFLARAYLAAFVTCVFGMHWLITSTVLGTVLLFFFGAAVFTVPFAVFYFLRRSFGWRTALWTAPLVWTAWDWLYQQSEGSFGWLAMGVTQSNLYWLVQYVDTTGVWGITFWLVLFNVLVVMSIERSFQFSVFSFQFSATRNLPESENQRFLKTENRKLKTVLKTALALRLGIVSGLMLAVPLAYSAYVFIKDARAAKDGGREISVLLVQPNVNPWEKLAEGSNSATLRKTIGVTNRSLAGSATKPDLIVWPETAVPYILSEEKEAREAVYRAVTRWQTPLLTGLLDASAAGDSVAVARGGGQPARDLFNSAALLSPGPEETGKRLNVEISPVYHKRMLVPFVERVPFVDRFPALKSLAVNVGAHSGFSRGREATVFSFRTRRGDEARVAAAICYEYLYPAEVAEFVRGGAQMLALITNEGWFSQSLGQYQLAAFSRLRSIETRRAAVRAANTGLTWAVDRLGRVHEQATWWSEQALPAQAALSDEMSLYVLYPDYFPKACAWASLVLLLGAAAIGVRKTVRSFQTAAGGAEVRRDGDYLEQT